MSLGNAIKKLRLNRGITLSELAVKVGSHVGNLSRIERDLSRPSIDLLYKIAGALEYQVSEIFAVSEDNTDQDSGKVALNSLFLALLDHDRELLLQFAELLKSRELPMELPAEIQHRFAGKTTFN